VKISGFGATIKRNQRNPHEELLSMAYPLVTLVLVDGFFAVFGECRNRYTWFVTVLSENRVPQFKKMIIRLVVWNMFYEFPYIGNNNPN
jgi:hypothetical protein